MIDRLRLEYAAEGFLSVMRRAQINRGEDAIVKTLNDYSPEDRGALMAAIQHAVKMSGPDHDKAYADWRATRTANAA